MHLSRIIIIILAIVLIGLIALFAYAELVAPSSSSAWASGAAYPLEVSGTSGIVGQSCVNGTATIYCVGGLDYNGDPRNAVYSATVSSSGMSDWTTDTPYPLTIGLQSCVSSGDYVYCVGGSYDDAGDDLNSSYFAPLNSTGVGPWSPTTAYPVPIDSQSCVSSSGYIYCVGGEEESNGLNATVAQTSSTWYAQITTAGIGIWKNSTSYPTGIYFESCAASSTDIFCVGGINSSSAGVDDVYYAPLSSSGIGQWSSTTSYSFDAYGQVCVIDSGSIICVGGVPDGTTSSSNAVYSAPVSQSGVGTWFKAYEYPVGVETACVAASGDLYCSGGYRDTTTITADTYYASVQSLLA